MITVFPSKYTRTPMATKKTKAYLAGIAAYEAGISVDDCPLHQDTSAKKQWLEGWYEARTKTRLPHIYAKYPD